MPIKFRCTGCKAKLYVPARWHGSSIVCPRCETRVMVPAEAGGGAVTSFEGREVEKSLDDLLVATEQVFETAPFSFPAEGLEEAGGAGRSSSGARSGRSRSDRPPALPKRVTLPRWVPYAWGAVTLLVAVGAFFLGAWWATAGTGP